MYKLEIEAEAFKDRDRIHTYIVEEFDNHAAASRLMSAFRKGFQKIMRQPYICPVLQTASPKEHEFRKLIIKRNYIAFYRIDEDKKLITIARIFHSKQNYESQL